MQRQLVHRRPPPIAELPFQACLPAQVDRWRSDRQDIATASVLDVLFGDGPPSDLHPAFVNVTRSFIVDDRPLPGHAGRLVLEHDVWVNGPTPSALRLLPPLTIRDEQIDEAVERLAAGLGAR